MKEIVITPPEEGQRLDRVLQRYLSRASSGFIYKMLRKKNITLNGKKASGSEKLSAGDVICLFFAECIEHRRAVGGGICKFLPHDDARPDAGLFCALQRKNAGL